MLAYCCSQSLSASCRCCSHKVWMVLIWSSLCVSSWRISSEHAHAYMTNQTFMEFLSCSSQQGGFLTGFVIGAASIVAQSTQSLHQSGVLGFEFFDQTLGGAFVHHRAVLDVLCPEKQCWIQKINYGIIFIPNLKYYHAWKLNELNKITFMSLTN